MMLRIERGLVRHRERQVREPVFVVGSEDSCDLVLADPQFSGIHFYFLRRGDRLWMRQVAAFPDVTVNGHTRTYTTMRHGDRIRTGPYEFCLLEQD